MSDIDRQVADALGQVVPLGSGPQEAELGAAVSRHVSSRTAPAPTSGDDEMVAALRAAGNGSAHPAGAVPPLSIVVDFNDLHADVGEPAVWRILARLKELFG